MGLFSSGPGEEIQELIDSASGDSVTADKLIKADTGLGAWDRLNDKPLIEYLDDEEQPHFIIAQQSKRGIHVAEDGDTHTYSIEPDGKFRIMMTVTDHRILFTIGGNSGDKTASVDFDSVKKVESRTKSKDGTNRVRIKIETDNNIYTFARIMTDAPVNIAGTASDEEEVQKAVEYISTQADVESEQTEKKKSDAATADTNSTSSEFSGLSNIEVSGIKNNNLPDTLAKIDDSIKSDETVHYAYTINAAERGDDHMGGVTTGGCLLATDRRLTAYVKETIGSSNLSIEYTKIDTVEIEHGAMITKLSVQSTSKTYSFPGFNSIDKSEIHDFADFIRNQASESNNDNGSNSTGDPTEQLKNIKELHDQGVLTDEEFEEKKSDLLDKI